MAQNINVEWGAYQQILAGERAKILLQEPRKLTMLILLDLIAEGGAIFFTKVVIQFLQFLSDNRATDILDAHVDLNDLENEEERDFETAEVS